MRIINLPFRELNYMCIFQPRLKLMVTIVLFFLITIGFTNITFGQNIYRSKNGIVSITGIYHGETITAHSKQVEALINYETSEFELKLGVADLHTGIDSIDQKLREHYSTIILKGALSINRINTTKHPPQDFLFSGVLQTQNENSVVNGEGRLEHIEAGEELACELALYFDTTVKALGLKTENENHQVVKIQFYKTILKQMH